METLLHAYYDGLRLFALDCFLLWITVIMASLFPWRIKLLRCPSSLPPWLVYFAAHDPTNYPKQCFPYIFPNNFFPNKP